MGESLHHGEEHILTELSSSQVMSSDVLRNGRKRRHYPSFFPRFCGAVQAREMCDVRLMVLGVSGLTKSFFRLARASSPSKSSHSSGPVAEVTFPASLGSALRNGRLESGKSSLLAS